MGGREKESVTILMITMMMMSSMRLWRRTRLSWMTKKIMMKRRRMTMEPKGWIEPRVEIQKNPLTKVAKTHATQARSQSQTPKQQTMLTPRSAGERDQ